MIAHISLPGGQDFEIARVRTRAQAEEWFAWYLRHNGETQQSLQAVRDGGVWTEKQAAKLRWRDGSKIVDESDRPVEWYADKIARDEAVGRNEPRP